MDPLPIQKIKCIFGYFHACLCIGDKPERRITFRRFSQGAFRDTDWSNNATAMMTQTDVDNGLTHIEDVCDKLDGLCWEVDFANSAIGGGVLGRGQVQEEIRFLQCPELIVCKLFMENLAPHEGLKIVGYKQFNVTTGYRSTFLWDRIKRLEPRHSRRMIVMDALNYGAPDQQYRQFFRLNVHRELNKARVSFTTGDDLPISTGHWGCGAFGGNKELKAVIQMLAAGMTGKKLHYCTLGDNYLEINDLAAAVQGKRVSDVYNLLLQSINALSAITLQTEAQITNFFTVFRQRCRALRN